MQNIFFSIQQQKQSKQEKKDFDAYSKTPNDIFNFYLNKYPEMEAPYKRSTPLEKSIVKSLLTSTPEKAKDFILSITQPFELYILAFILHMQNKVILAKLCFTQALQLLEKDSSLEQLANKVMIKIQLSQLYDKIRDRKNATQNLLSIVEDFKQSEELTENFSNLLASTYMRLGVYLLREYKVFNPSQAAFFLSIKFRKQYKDTYEPLVYEQYLATALRNYAATLQDPLEKYILYKESLAYRFFVMNAASDEFNKAEAMYTLCDIVRFLIIENFKSDLVVKYSRTFYKVIGSLKPETRAVHSSPIVKYSLILCKYFYQMGDIFSSLLWFKMAKHTAVNIQNPTLTAEIQQLEEHYLSPFLVAA